jgi:hypothetical protein
VKFVNCEVQNIDLANRADRCAEMVDRLVGKERNRRNWLLSLQPLGRLGTSELRAAVPYLASDAEKFNSGADLKTRHK